MFIYEGTNNLLSGAFLKCFSIGIAMPAFGDHFNSQSNCEDLSATNSNCFCCFCFFSKPQRRSASKR